MAATMDAPLTNPGWYYAQTPEPVPQASKIFALQNVDLPALEEGMFMTKTLAVAIAPHTRAFLELPGNNTGAESIGLHRTKIGELLPCEFVAEVVETKSKKYAVGDRISCFAPLVLYQVFRDDGKDRQDGMAPAKVLASVSTETWLNLSTGITAYLVINKHPCGRVHDSACGGCFSFLRGRAPKTVLVTSAAGAIGVLAGQMYKNKGCKVIGVCSTRAKADRLKEYGYDAVIAYKEEDIDKRLGELAPEGIDVFFDNVGAHQLDAGSKHMKVHGRIVQVGCASEIDNYATGNITGWKEYLRLASRELQVGGFLLTNHFHEMPEAVLALAFMLKCGKLKTTSTVVNGKWEDFTACVDRLHSGDTFGRLILQFDEFVAAGTGA
eukprot:TRINITY_DN103814_c0_g1_i1.p1 TRINITY_DN103814_c0_g1~~TRINITY_DN103814_c0_g1_i1.p1  ORF type:complete len:401 (-),score=69.31 TRINITY_DN103814_c0_g1_i1:266-1408(-)